MNLECPICGGNQWLSCYHGSIRMGSFGKQSSVETDIWECRKCGARHLLPLMEDVESYYRSGEYRQDLGQGNAVETYFQLTDDDQPHKLAWLGMHKFRGKIIADIGAGAGPFLDLVRGVAAQTIAVEPNQGYHESLRQRGHLVFPSTESMLKEWAGKIDAAVSFSVLEHVENPRQFLAEIRSSLKPDGWLAISTPNADDLMVEISRDYAGFFYRKVHLWYFRAPALQNLAQLAGFARCEIHFEHRFDLSNALVWLRDKRPSGLGTIRLDGAMDAGWRHTLISTGRSDYLYAVLR